MTKMFTVQWKLFLTLLSAIFFELPITRTPENSNFFFNFLWRFELSGVDCITNRLSLDYQICKITLFSNRTRSIFHLSRVNRLKFSSCCDFILVKMDKKILLKGFLSIFFCYWGYFIWKFARVFFFGTIHPFLGWLVDIVRSLRLNLFKFSPFWGFILVKIAKKLLLKGWILSYFFFLWLGLFSLKIGKGVFLAQFTLFSGVSLTFFILWGWISFNFHLFELLFWWKLTKIYSCNGKCFQILIFTLVIGVACVASVSARVRREKLGREQK